MRKLSYFLFIMTLFTRPVLAMSYNAAIVADMDSGKILYAENADDTNYPASLTKIMTLYLTFNALEQGRLKLDQNLIVSKTAAGSAPVKIGLPAGSKITVENAIKSVAVYSANDMAVVLSENLTGDEGDFAAMMTQVAEEIGLKNTHFANASGLSEDDHVSTAKDIALLAIAVRKHYPKYWKYFSIPYFSYNGKSFRNGNALLGTYPGCDGMKTGFTNRSRYSLISTAEQNGKHLVAVVLGADNKSDRATISRALLDFGFGKTDSLKIPRASQVKIAAPAPVQYKQEKFISENNQSVGGSCGVQFGAFGTQATAKIQQSKIYSIFGLQTYLEKFSGMIRVRAKMTYDKAQKIKGQCSLHGVDCYVFQ
jgi:D-alanyl-D-alanine carboxypeptidase